MTHWGWYWSVKRKHKPKALCSWFVTMNSFELFNNRYLRYIELGQPMYSVPRFNLSLTMGENSLHATHNGGTYDIPVERKLCNFGGSYFFFHCPKCDKRMRILYCVQGVFLCRKCANLGYFIQRVRPGLRCLIMRDKIKEKIESRAGSLDRKPPWMKKRTYEQLKKRCAEYGGIKYSKAKLREAIET
jgi:hypothetical protein